MNKPLQLVLFFCLLFSCKKKELQLSSNKTIETFAFTAVLNPGLLADISGVVKNDSVLVLVPSTVSLSSLTPNITFSGSSINPANCQGQNFTNPVVYSVTAEDKSVKNYVVCVRLLSAEKSITSFVFRASDNPTALSSDATGVISNDSIFVTANTTDVSNLKPFITYNGKAVTPPNGAGADYTNPVSYTVVAEDGTTKKYTVVVSTTSSLFIGCDDGFLYAFDAINGRVRWKTAIGYSVKTCPTYAAGVVYITAGTYLYAFDATTGVFKWKANLIGNATTSPQVVNNVVYTVATNTTYDWGTVTATDATTGTIRWQQSVYEHIGACNPTVSDGVIVVGNGESLLVGYDATTGQQVWKSTVGIVLANPAVVNGVVYVPTEFSRMMAADIITGIIKWSVPQPYNQVPKNFTSPTIANGTIYTSTDSLYAFDATTGVLKWQSGVGAYALGNLAVENNFIYANAQLSDVIYAYNNDGTLKWRYNDTYVYSQVFTAAPGLTVANQRLYTGSPINNKLVALDVANGTLLWSYQSTARFSSSACVIDGNGHVFHSALSGAQQ
ncbi:MAG: outer membrane protein assembly factor BamB family protein [Flavisolibacter sp.]